ncbi:tyrosine-type recombinase/integrase [Escherichia coli]
MSTQVIHTSYTERTGYVWRQRYAGSTLSITLKTKDEKEAAQRSGAMSIRFMQLEQLAVPFQSMRDTLRAYRDDLCRMAKLAFLNMMMQPQTEDFRSGSQSAISHLAHDRKSHLAQTTSFDAVSMASQDALQAPVAPAPMQEATQHAKVLVATVQRELDTSVGHSLESVKKEYFDANTEWSAKTIKDYNACIDRFIVWASTVQICTLEAVTKTAIIDFKAYMDHENLAPNTKQKVLVRIGSMFNFAVNIKEYIVKNPVQGLMYKKVANVKQKEAISPEQFATVMGLNQVKNDNQTYWLMNMLYYTGMRIGEMQQVTKTDYVEIEGIKCISVNTLEEGKTTKTETSIRNIPLCDKLLELGVWETKPVLKNGANRNMDAISRSFKLISLKRSSHCFRHSISDRLRDTNADDSTRAFILGHAQANMTDRVYVTRKPLLKMLAALNEANV